MCKRCTGKGHRKNTLDDFWKYVDKSGDCWVWTGAKTSKGYGAFQYEDRLQSAHRISWMIHNGPFPEGGGGRGWFVLHRCDNPPCVNPAHLWIGTHQDNMDDRQAKGRQSRQGHPPGPTGPYSEERIRSARAGQLRSRDRDPEKWAQAYIRRWETRRENERKAE